MLLIDLIQEQSHPAVAVEINTIAAVVRRAGCGRMKEIIGAGEAV